MQGAEENLICSRYQKQSGFEYMLKELLAEGHHEKEVGEVPFSGLALNGLLHLLLLCLDL